MRIWRTRRALVWIALALGLLVGLGLISAQFIGSHEGDLVINELLASNASGLQDADGDYPDWIEIHNRSSGPVNLAGWALSDDPDQPEKWPFPDVTLGGQQYLVVYATGKNRRPAVGASELHTNFRLRKEGEFLGLYDMLGSRWADRISPQFPAGSEDVSFGRSAEGWGFFGRPTPGAANDEASAWKGVTSGVEFSAERGFYEAPFDLELKTATPGAVIRYTQDGSEPAEEAGLVFDGPVRIQGTTVVRAAAFKPGFMPSSSHAQTYLFLDDVAAQPAAPPGFPPAWGDAEEAVPADYEMDPDVVNDPRYRDTLQDGLKSIPSLSIVMDPQQFSELYSHPEERGAEWERPASIELIQPDPAQAGLHVNAGIRIHGGVGRALEVPKHSFRLYFREKYGAAKLAYPVFPDSPVETFDVLVLRAGTHDGYAGAPGRSAEASTYIRDEWLRASQLAVTGLGVHGTFVHVYINGLYWGMYNLVERPDDSFMSAYLGGQPEEWMVANQRGLVSGPDDQARQMLQLVGIGDPAERLKAIEPLIDTGQFLDYMILNWYAGTRDWPMANWYASMREPEGKLRFFVWDGERILSSGARIRLGGFAPWPNIVRPIFEAMMQSPEYRLELADRMVRHLFNDGALADANSQARWREISNFIERAMVGESARWGDVRYGTPVTQADWLVERDRTLVTLEGNAGRLIRLAREQGYYPPIDPPEFNQHGGLVAAGFALEMAAPQGTIVYTTDGSDPRQAGSGAVASSAVAYEAPRVLTTTTQVKARALQAGPAGDAALTWSALQEATFRVVESDSRLRFTEIMYNPLDGDDYEFIELKNTGEAELDLSSASFEGIRFTFPAGRFTLGPGQFVVVGRDAAAFSQRYPGVKLAGVYQGQLSNQGEQIVLRSPRDEILASVAYDDENGWPISADGRGDSAVLVDAAGDPGDPRNWRASSHLHGSPGADDPPR